jgi:hypothetical protein
MAAETDHIIISTASWLFGAFVAGVASKDVAERRMTAEQAASWRAHTVSEFEKNLRERAFNAQDTGGRE